MVERFGSQPSEDNPRANAVEALRDLLAWAERYRGGDPSLHVEEWYIARDYARIALEDADALAAPSPDPEGEQR